MFAIEVSPWSLITATGALLAFLIGLFTLVGRERKAPYLINSVFLIFLLCTVGAAVDVIAAIVPASSPVSRPALAVGALFLVVALLVTSWRVYKLYVRFVLFVDSPSPKHWRIAKLLAAMRRAQRPNKPYEHNPIDVDDKTRATVIDALSSHQDWSSDTQNEPVHSCAIAVQHQGQANSILAEVAFIFLEANYSVQYVATARHPIDFIDHLHDHVVKQKDEGFWKKVAARVIAVDAYTPHFGYTDSIYDTETRRMQSEFQVDYLKASASYAGLHTASSVAFNRLRKKKAGADDLRDPVLIVYEDCFSLADLESPEQYRVFVRHVLPSEKMWGGMFTLFVETSPSPSDWNLLRSYAGLVVDSRAQHIAAAQAVKT